MTSRYDTLNVSILSDNKEKQRLNKTLEVSTEKQQQSSKGDGDQKVNRFKQLYYKNQKLRKELKLLNQKLNQKLEKLKLPFVKKKAMSVDLNHNPPSKALQRQLENAYKQVAMYRKQIQALKGKEETPLNYDKLRNVENMISFMDMEISHVQEELKSIKSIMKMQQKVITEDVDNAELKQRLNDYQNEIKSYKDKIKDNDRKSKKREQDFKRQQAYLVAIEQKNRKNHQQEKQYEKPEVEKVKQISQFEFRQVKQEIYMWKKAHEDKTKKIQQTKKTIKNIRQQKYAIDERLREKQVLHKQLVIQVLSFTRLLKDLEIKAYELSGVRPENKERSDKIIKLQEIEDEQQERLTVSENSRNQELELSKLSNIQGELNKDQREWKGKMRKVSMGYTTPNDQIFQQSGNVIGLKIYLDENKSIIGLAIIMKSQGVKSESRVFGNTSNVELKWQCQQRDELSKINGSFTEQGYLGEIILGSKNGLQARFGNAYPDTFQFNILQGQMFSGIFGGIRKMGQDVRITEIGFWISKN